MRRKQDKETRYYIDLDVRTRTILTWDYGQRYELEQELENPAHHRVFISKGQYNKLMSLHGQLNYDADSPA